MQPVDEVQDHQTTGRSVAQWNPHHYSLYYYYYYYDYRYHSSYDPHRATPVPPYYTGQSPVDTEQHRPLVVDAAPPQYHHQHSL